MKKEIFYLIGAVAGALLVLWSTGNVYWNIRFMVGWTQYVLYESG